MAGRRPYKLPKALLIDPDTEITLEVVNKYIDLHEERMPRYKYLENLYYGFHDIYNQPEKAEWKPDNRMSVNFARYCVDTFVGFAYGIPIKRSHPDERANGAIRDFDRDNDIADHEYELAKKACIYGHAFEYMYQDEDAHTKVTDDSPKGTFIVYDDSVKRRGVFVVRYGYKNDGVTRAGELITRDRIRPFNGNGLGEGSENPFGRLPAVEYALNRERIGLYEQEANMIEKFNKAMSEKANDIDAFAEAYMVVLGAELDEEGIYKIRDNRLINLYGTDDAKDILVQFLSKPTADETQEKFLDRTNKLIFQMAMVANMADENFGRESGATLSYRLQDMNNLAITMDKKMIKSLNKRYKLFCSLSTNVSVPDTWRDIQFKPTRNMPKNNLEEAQTAQALDGVVSKETQLKVLSVVDDVAEEIERIETEAQPAQETIVDNRMFGVKADGQ